MNESLEERIYDMLLDEQLFRKEELSKARAVLEQYSLIKEKEEAYVGGLPVARKGTILSLVDQVIEQNYRLEVLQDAISRLGRVTDLKNWDYQKYANMRGRMITCDGYSFETEDEVNWTWLIGGSIIDDGPRSLSASDYSSFYREALRDNIRLAAVTTEEDNSGYFGALEKACHTMASLSPIELEHQLLARLTKVEPGYQYKKK